MCAAAAVPPVAILILIIMLVVILSLLLVFLLGLEPRSSARDATHKGRARRRGLRRPRRRV